jgi:hypothetical protein
MPISQHMQIQCGSELARDGGLAVNISVECNGLIASMLAPTVEGGVAQTAIGAVIGAWCW